MLPKPRQNGATTVVAEKCLLTVDAKIVVKDRQDTIGVEGNVKYLMNEEVIARPLADNPEVVNERFGVLSVLKGPLESILCYTRCLIFVTGRFAGARDALGLKVGRSTHIVAVDSKRDQCVQWAA